jgi:uncharacterized protein (TIGR02246 family)
MIRLYGWVRTGAALAGMLLAASCSTSNSQPVQTPQAGGDAVDNRIAEEAAIRATDAAWVKAAQAKDVSTMVSYYAENASVYIPGQRLVEGKDAINRAFASLMSMPGFALEFTPDTVMVARSGDIAYETGDYSMTMDDKSGKPQTSKAKYVVVWVKQPDGTWKAMLDAPTTTQ